MYDPCSLEIRIKYSVYADTSFTRTLKKSTSSLNSNAIFSCH